VSRKPIFIAIFLAGLFLHGCAGIYTMVEFEILEPATVSLPEDVRQLLILNRAPITTNAFSEEDRNNMTREQLVIVDTLIVNNEKRGLFQVLQQSPIEQFQHPIWLDERRRDTALLDDLILTRREVDDLCHEYGAQAILSLESYSMDLDLSIQYYEYESDLVQSRYYEISTRVRWIIYLPGNPRPFDTYNLSDTLFFPDIVDGNMMVPSTDVSTMIREGFYGSGVKYGRYLVPAWVHAERQLYRGREDSLKIAAKETDAGDWDKAYSIWRRLTESGDNTLVAKAYHNMAVYYELEDNLDSASSLINLAAGYDSLPAVKAYLEELEMRILNRQELYKQVR
jgi:hypothetical protein